MRYEPLQQHGWDFSEESFDITKWQLKHIWNNLYTFGDQIKHFFKHKKSDAWKNFSRSLIYSINWNKEEAKQKVYELFSHWVFVCI